MSTLGLIALAIAAVIVGLVLLRRGRPAAPERPKTVADLVRLRAESAGSAVAAGVGAGTGGREASAPGSAAVLPGARPSIPAPQPPSSAAAPADMAATPESPTPTVDLPRQARSEESATGLVPTIDDTPWGRAARMVSGDAGSGAWRAPESVDIVPLRLLTPDTPSDRSSATTLENWSGWADWADVDAEEDARANPARPAPDLRFGTAASGSGTETSAGRGRASETGGAGEAPPVDEPAAGHTAAATTGSRKATSDGSGTVTEPAGAGEAADGPSAAGARRAEPSAAQSRTAPGPVRAVASAAPATGTPVVAERPAGTAAPDAAAESSNGTKRGRPSADERAAEQAAADLALLRTFGFADPSLRPDSAPVVSLISQQEPAPEPVSGTEQPVRFRAARRGGVPAEGVAVMLLDDRGRTVAKDKAGPDGRGEVLAPAPGGYVLVCTALGHQPGAAAITVADAPIDAEVLLVRSASLFGSVHGEDGPVANARVTLVQDGEIVDAVDTDAEGAYRIGDIAAGDYGLSVVAAGCEPIAVLIEVPDEAELRHDVDLAPAGAQAEYDPADDDDFMIGKM